MEMILAVFIPLAILAGVLAVVLFVQALFHWGASRSHLRQRQHQQIVDGFVREVALAQTQLARRGRELETAAERLQRGNEELARLNTMKNKFLAMAVHDVRNPLAAAKGYAQLLLKRGQYQSSEKPMINAIIQSTEQVNTLISDLTDLALIEAGKMRIEKAPFPISDMIAAVSAPVGFVAEKRGVSYAVVDVEPGIVLNADKGRLSRVLSNLLGNAVKFTPAGGSVELRARVEGSNAAFYVKDTGPGIHPEERVKIFQKFYQSKHLKDETARAAGWGLGLAIAEEIVRGHGGQIGVDSPGLGRGATFWFRIPGVKAAAAALLCFGLAVIAPLAARAQGLPLAEREEFERSLERRAQDVLSQVIGPNRARVVVEAELDFTRIERFDVKGATVASVAPQDYLWNPGASNANATELLPGIPLPGIPDSQQLAAGPRSYEKSSLYPSDFVKRLTVTLVLDEKIDPARAEELRSLVSSVLGVRLIRGDTVTLARARFEPVWRTLWYQPETAAQAYKYLLASILGLLTLAVVAISLIRLTSAMREMAHAQSQQITMDLTTGDKAGQPGDVTMKIEDGTGGHKNPALPAPGDETTRFVVRPDQIEVVVAMLRSEKPENIALIAEHLDGEIRTSLLAHLNEDTAAQVAAALAKVRFVEPDMLVNLKTEFERRLAGAVGGLEQAAHLLEGQAMNERSRMLRGIERLDPELAKSLRRKSPTYESLLELSEQQWADLIGRLTNVDWGCLLPEIPVAAVPSLRGVLTESAWKVVQQVGEGVVPSGQKRAAEAKLEGALRDVLAGANEALAAPQEVK